MPTHKENFANLPAKGNEAKVEVEVKVKVKYQFKNPT
jgi:hypothetical protein